MFFSLTREQVEHEHKTLIDMIIDDGSMYRGFAAYLMDRLPSDFGPENMRNLASFLESMLQRDPQSRKSAAVLLQHPFPAGEPDMNL